MQSLSKSVNFNEVCCLEGLKFYLFNSVRLLNYSRTSQGTRESKVEEADGYACVRIAPDKVMSKNMHLKNKFD